MRPGQPQQRLPRLARIKLWWVQYHLLAACNCHRSSLGWWNRRRPGASCAEAAARPRALLLTPSPAQGYPASTILPVLPSLQPSALRAKYCCPITFPSAAPRPILHPGTKGRGPLSHSCPLGQSLARAVTSQCLGFCSMGCCCDFYFF